jgi:hypothetical protein
MNCFDVQEKMIDLLHNELTPEDEEAIRQHLQECVFCRQEFQFLHECLQVCSLDETETCVCQFKETYWDEFILSVHDKITHEKIEQPFPFKIVLPIAASVLAAAALSYFFIFRPKPETTAGEDAPSFYEYDPYEEIHELSPEETEKFIELINQRYGE